MVGKFLCKHFFLIVNLHFPLTQHILLKQLIFPFFVTVRTNKHSSFFETTTVLTGTLLHKLFPLKAHFPSLQQNCLLHLPLPKNFQEHFSIKSDGLVHIFLTIVLHFLPIQQILALQTISFPFFVIFHKHFCFGVTGFLTVLQITLP